MRQIMESAFDIAYLVSMAVMGVLMLKRGKGLNKLFGCLTLVLAGGDAFHLVPRIIGLNSPLGLEGYTAALGIGKLVTSITMTIFYVMLYHFWQQYTGKQQDRKVTLAVWGLAAMRIILCLFPQNAWTSANAPVIWGVYRNIPFVALGALIVVLLWKEGKTDSGFKWAWLAVTLSFAFYIPVVLWADVSPMIGMLMLPKTCCYVWLVTMGFRKLK